MEMCADSFNSHIPTSDFKHTQDDEKGKKNPGSEPNKTTVFRSNAGNLRFHFTGTKPCQQKKEIYIYIY